MKYLILAACAVTILMTACGSKDVTKADIRTLSKTEKVIELLNSIESGDSEPASYINPDKYIQHNLMAADGLAGFADLMAHLPEGGAKVEVVRAFEDGDYVFTHTEYDFFGPKIGFDIFRFEDGLIVEHWDNLQEIATQTASGRSQIDGADEAVELEKTNENKALVKGFVEDILMGGNPSKITDYVSTQEYLQHNPAVPDGLDALGIALQEMADAGMPMIYTKNHMILGQGNFVLTVSEGSFLNKHVSFYDLFRIDDGKIVEHWDTIEEILPKEEWKNDNGKF